MRVVTYNIRLALDSSLARIGENIRELRADLVCLQEVGRHWTMGEPVDMRTVLMQYAQLPYGVFAPALQRGEAQYGIALLSRFPLHVLVRRPLSRLADEPRVLLGCQVAGREGDWLVFTTHLSVVPGDRPAQCDELARWVSQQTKRSFRPLILAGDFNAGLGDVDLAELIERLQVRSALVEIHSRSLPTYPAKTAEFDIDHVLVGPTVAIEDASVATMAGSDHLPVWADVIGPRTS